MRIQTNQSPESKNNLVVKANIDKKIKYKKFIIVDNVITTGGSVKAFATTLQNNKIKTCNVVALMVSAQKPHLKKLEDSCHIELTYIEIFYNNKRRHSYLGNIKSKRI
ncbi:MAG: hypothetical protein K8R67_03830 [Desulfobacteraceae bacterium]|nr:hypothetical protein [Desulfobacteraceae bacterium]